MQYAYVNTKKLINFTFGKEPTTGLWFNFNWELLNIYTVMDDKMRIFVFKILHHGKEYRKSLPDHNHISIEEAADTVCSQIEYLLYPM